MTVVSLPALSKSDCALLAKKTAKLRDLMSRAAESIYEIGCELIQIKAILGHGHFLGWLQEEFEWSERMARRFIDVALKMEKSAQNGQIGRFAPSALYLLAAPGTPEEAREEACEQAEAGRQITYTGAQEIVERHKAAREALDSLAPEDREEIKRAALDHKRRQQEAADTTPLSEVIYHLEMARQAMGRMKRGRVPAEGRAALMASLKAFTVAAAQS